jgi:hypothetical protein
MAVSRVPNYRDLASTDHCAAEADIAVYNLLIEPAVTTRVQAATKGAERESATDADCAHELRLPVPLPAIPAAPW